MKKTLYINGCSFTRGDSLEENETWPYLLEKSIQPIEYTNDSANGNSFGSIFYNTLSKLSALDSYDDLFVVIGITWSPRYSVFFDKTIASITPADIFDGGTKTDFHDKRSTHRRMVSPYFKTWPMENEHREAREQDGRLDIGNGYNLTLTSYAEFYNNATKYDPNLKHNQNISLLAKVVALQSFFETNNINYKFIDFSNITTGHSEDKPTVNLRSKINLDNVLLITSEYLRNNNFIDEKTSHPNKEGCKYIADKLLNIYNEL